MKPITEKQKEVCRLLCDGDCDKEIAAKLNLSIGGVRRHVGALMVKLGKRSRAGVAVAFDREERSSNRNSAY